MRFDADTVRDAWRIRKADREQLYRPPRRCPICFAGTVRTYDQTNGHVIRSCKRCRCRYLGSFPTAEELERTRDLRIRKQAEREADAPEGLIAARRKTLLRRAAFIRRMAAPGSRLLEIGARRGDLGELLADQFDYTGIELSDVASRDARSRGVNVLCAKIEQFVNTGAPFDAIVMIDVFQHLPNPHEVLTAIREQMKSGAVLLMVTPDTESLMSSVCRKRWSAYKMPEHVILYSRSALIELLEHSGFEIVSVASDFHHFAQERMRLALERWPRGVQLLFRSFLAVLPDPLFGSSGSIRVIARRRSGAPVVMRSVTAMEATQAR